MQVSDAALATFREVGYVVVEGFLGGDELAEARDALWTIYPPAEAYFADDDAPEHRQLRGSPFAGVRPFPFGGWALDRLAVHEDLIDFAERFYGTTDIEIYKGELWAKYAGAADYQSKLHRDFNSHSLVVPRRDGRWVQITTFVLLSDVTELDAPPALVSLGESAALGYVPTRHPDAEVTQVLGTGPAGTLLAFRSDLLHRATDFGAPGRSRFVLLVDLQERGQPWLGKMSWPGRAHLEGMHEALERMTPRQRSVLGFPPVGHEYWNSQTLADVQDRYPGMDLSAYEAGVRSAG